MTKDNSSNKM